MMSKFLVTMPASGATGPSYEQCMYYCDASHPACAVTHSAYIPGVAYQLTTKQ